MEKQAESASEALARLRWHWTLDESNPQRVSLREYARQVDTPFSGVVRYARGYAKWVDHPGMISLSAAIVSADMSAETEAVTEAVAQARGASQIAQEGR